MTLAWRASAFAGAGSGFDRRWRHHAAMLAGVWAALLLIFHRDVADLAGIYWTNTTFGHCLFIAPVVGWLVWQRRAELAQVPPAGWWPGLVLVAAAGFGWLLGEVAGVAVFRHLGLVGMLQGAVVAVLGPNVARALLFPLTYMLFLVPFGEALQAPLQDLTVAMVMPLLHFAGVPATVDGVLITTPNGYFEVAEACSGVKFLIAMVAYGVLVAHVCFVSWRRRIAFIAMALVVPVLANGVRAFGTIFAAFHTSVEAATGFDHILYGWVFFAVVMAAVLAIGWRWFDRDPDAPAIDPARLQRDPGRRLDASVAALLVLAVASLFVAWSGAIAARTAPLPARIELPVVPGWERVDLSTTEWEPNYPRADHYLHGRYADAMGVPVDLVIAVYGSQREGKELVGFGQGAIRENDRWVRIADRPSLRGGGALLMTAPGPVERETVTWYRIGGVTTGSPGRVKLETLKVKLLGGNQAGVALLASAEGDRDATRPALERFVRALGGVDRVADRAAGVD